MSVIEGVSKRRRGSTVVRDLTDGSVTRQLLMFAMPLFLSGLLQTVYNMVDMMVVGRTIGKNGLSAVSIGGEVLNFLTFIGMGLANAGQIIIALYLGAKRHKSIEHLVGTLMVTETLSALGLMGVCLLLRGSILSWLNTPEEPLPQAASYLTVCCLGLPFIYGYNVVSAILRGLGDSKHPLMFVAIASMVNLVLDLFFIVTLDMGVAGAALATVLGQSISLVCSLVFLYRRRAGTGFSLARESLRADSEELGALVRLGVPMMLQFAAVTLSKLIITAWINPYGAVITSVTAIGNKIAAWTNVFSQAFSTAGGSMIAQNLGAEKYDRVPRIVGVTFVIDLVLAALSSALILLFPNVVFGLFTRDAEVLRSSREFLLTAVILFLGCGLRPPMNALINGSGNARLNLAIALLDGIVARILLAYLMSFVLEMGYRGCWCGNALAGLVPFFIGSFYFIRGKWRTRRYLIRQAEG